MAALGALIGVGSAYVIFTHTDIIKTITGGMFIPFYPDAFFASVDWTHPIELILVHESLHFNATDGIYGRRLEEGVTEAAARLLVVRFGMLDADALKRLDAYPEERKAVERVLTGIMERTSRDHEYALEMLLAGYLSGQQAELNTVFGAGTWQEVLKLSHSRGTWQAHRVAKILGD